MTFTPLAWFREKLSYQRFVGKIWPQLQVETTIEYQIRRKCLKQAWRPTILKCPVGKRLLVISPHPDDESIGPGGLLWAHRGLAEIHILSLTDGEKGGRLSTPQLKNHKVPVAQLMAKTRRRELASVARLLGAHSLTFFGYPDGAVPTKGEAVNRLSRLIKKVNPDVVLLPWFLDSHIDHMSANLLYARASGSRRGTVLGYEIWDPAEPNALFEITGSRLRGKLSMIQHYRSQLRTVDYVTLAKTLAKYRAFYSPVNKERKGMVEGYVALSNRKYCSLAIKLSR